MAFCSKCGTQINDNASFCPSCGTPSAPRAQSYAQPQAQQSQPQAQAQNYAQPYAQQPPVYGYVKPSIPGRGLGIAGMVLGIIGLFYSFVMMINVIDYVDSLSYYYYRYSSSLNESMIIGIVFCSIFSILAVSLAGAGRNKGYKTGVSASGVVMGIIGIALSLISIIIVVSA